MSLQRNNGASLHFGFMIVSVAVVLFRLLSEAWVSEDAQITFRTIENFVDGFGIRWNIDERVQVSTHPLWLLVNSAVYAVTREITFTVTGVGLACTLGAFVRVAVHLKEHAWSTWFVFLALFATSPTMMLYGTSGFETSLSFLMLALFISELCRVGESEGPRWGRLLLWAGLLAFNRLDCVLIVAPPLALLGIVHWRSIAWKRVFLGLSPVLTWFTFSLAYYGFLFPNTAPAKLSAAISRDAYVREGLLYVANVVRWDLVAVPVLLAFLFTGGRAALRYARNRAEVHAGCIAALSVGTLLYGLYVVRIGGGFLSGRFWAPVLFSAIVIVAMGVRDLVALTAKATPRVLFASVTVVSLCAVGMFQFAAHTDEWRIRGDIHERSLAHVRLNVTDGTFTASKQAKAWSNKGRRAQSRAKKSSTKRYVVKRRTIGFFGQAAGEGVTIVDPLALADPLLARLPMDQSDTWMIGHLPRSIPEGYMRARRTGNVDRMDPSLGEYYGHLRLVTSGPVFTLERWQTILNFHLGKYDYLLDEWKNRRLE